MNTTFDVTVSFCRYTWIKFNDKFKPQTQKKKIAEI